MESTLMIKKVKEEISSFLRELCSSRPDNDVLEYSEKLEREFEVLEKFEKKDALFSNTVQLISHYINLLIEKFKHLYLSLKLSYLREKFELCIKSIMPETQIN